MTRSSHVSFFFFYRFFSPRSQTSTFYLFDLRFISIRSRASHEVGCWSPSVTLSPFRLQTPGFSKARFTTSCSAFTWLPPVPDSPNEGRAWFSDLLDSWRILKESLVFFFSYVFRQIFFLSRHVFSLDGPNQLNGTVRFGYVFSLQNSPPIFLVLKHRPS